MKQEDQIIHLLTEIRNLQQKQLDSYEENLTKQKVQYDEYLKHHRKQIMIFAGILFLLIIILIVGRILG